MECIYDEGLISIVFFFSSSSLSKGTVVGDKQLEASPKKLSWTKQQQETSAAKLLDNLMLASRLTPEQIRV